MRLTLSILLSSSLFLDLGCNKRSPEVASDVPDFVPASARVFDYQRDELARVARDFGRTPQEIFSKEQSKGRDAVFSALQLLCSWKYINRRPMTQIERFTLCVQALPMEVNNGGFHQYFSNSTGDDWDIIAWGISESGDTDGLARFSEVLAVFPNGHPLRNRESRHHQLDTLGEAQWTVFKPFDTRFYEKSFLDWDKAWALIVKRSSEFSPEWPDEIPESGRTK